MTNQELINLKAGLEQNIQGLKSLRGIKFAYALNKNFKMLATEIETFSEMFMPTEGYKLFEEDRTELCKEFCEKDTDGNLVFTNNNSAYAIDITSEAWKEAYKALEEKHKEAIDEHNQKIEDYNAFLIAESEIELHKISIDEVPESISVEEYEWIQYFIQE